MCICSCVVLEFLEKENDNVVASSALALVKENGSCSCHKSPCKSRDYYSDAFTNALVVLGLCSI